MLGYAPGSFVKTQPSSFRDPRSLHSGVAIWRSSMELLMTRVSQGRACWGINMVLARLERISLIWRRSPLELFLSLCLKAAFASILTVFSRRDLFNTRQSFFSSTSWNLRRLWSNIEEAASWGLVELRRESWVPALGFVLESFLPRW